MGLTTRIRFSAPTDPREVWQEILRHINPPADYQWSNVPVGGNQIAWRNPLIYAESGQGADIWAYVAYGPDGCRLVDEEDDPPAFVEASLISDWSSVELHDKIIDALADKWAWITEPLWVRDDLSEWEPVT